MTSPSPCPPVEALRALFEAARPPRQSPELLSHLETCAECRTRIAAAVPRKVVHPTFWDSPAEKTQPVRPAAAAVDDWSVDADDDGGLPRRFGRFEVVGVIGRGNMGVVLKAVDPALNRFVAIKYLTPAFAADPESRRRFAVEAEAASRVGSDNVVAVYEFGKAAGTPYLVMEYARGQDLGARLRAGPPVGPEEALRIGRQVAAGLAAAHAQGVVHRDVKPGNIILESPDDAPAPVDGVWARAKVTDFGIARLVGEPGLTSPGGVVGTPEYISPEQIEAGPVDHRCDLYALGMVLYRLLAGRSPFDARTVHAFLDQHRFVQPPPPSAFAPGLVPPAVDRLVLELVRKDPAERVQTAAEVVRRLDAALAGTGGATADPAEERRAAALRRYQILDSDPEQAFDDLTFLASHLCGTPIALISLVDVDRQWFKSKVGLSVSQTARSISFCQHTIRGTEPFVVGDAATDPRFADNLVVRGAPHVRFYAGMPLIDPEGYALGSMCVIDRAPRQLTTDQLAALAAIARLVVDRIRIRQELLESRGESAER